MARNMLLRYMLLRQSVAVAEYFSSSCLRSLVAASRVRWLATSASDSSSPTVGADDSSKVTVEEFVKKIGEKVVASAGKVAGEVASVEELLDVRSGKLKKLGIPCKQRKLILRHTEQYRQGIWTPEARG
eukprot:TRINITY_DN32824_c0_g1_i1.p2 TRINITY_DN32824_c0_g1~~TRINITY_DN32824_c0_g1_i1.p2  ORF type:complete len:129 (+),score=24.28 TRINITY_DN32824_c0_g1_i1:425-811(+)